VRSRHKAYFHSLDHSSDGAQTCMRKGIYLGSYVQLSPLFIPEPMLPSSINSPAIASPI
jgi:hypothetical protein